MQRQRAAEAKAYLFRQRRRLLFILCHPCYYRRGGCSTTRPACQHLLLRRSSSNPWLMHTLALGVYPPCGRPCLAHSSAEIRHAHPGHLAECLAFRLGLEEEMRWRVVRRQWHEALVKHELFKVRFGHGDVRHRLRRSPACAVRLCHAGSVDRTRGGAVHAVLLKEGTPRAGGKCCGKGRRRATGQVLRVGGQGSQGSGKGRGASVEGQGSGGKGRKGRARVGGRG